MKIQYNSLNQSVSCLGEYLRNSIPSTYMVLADWNVVWDDELLIEFGVGHSRSTSTFVYPWADQI